MARAATHPLARLIPDDDCKPRDDGGEYISRYVSKVLDMDLLKYAHHTSQPLMMFGDTGPGKTSMVMAYCAKYNIPLVTVMCNGGIDPSAFWVFPVPDAEQGFRLIETDLLTAVRHGNCVIYFDEINFASAKVLAALNSLLDKRRQVTVLELGNELVKAGPNLLIVATFNPEYEGVRSLNAALRNRFKIKLHIDYDPRVEEALLCMPIMHDIARKLRAQRHTEIRTPVSTNMLIEFEQIAVDVSLDFAITNFLAAFAPTEREAVSAAIDLVRHDLELQAAKMEDD